MEAKFTGNRQFHLSESHWPCYSLLNFRNYVHLPEDIFRVAADSGLRPVHQSFSGTWQSVVFER